MSIAQLMSVPRHLLAATVERGRERIPVRVKQIGPDRIVIGPVPLALRERARLTIACPLSATGYEVTAEAVRKNPDSTLLFVIS
jgi:hypothetical protein